MNEKFDRELSKGETDFMASHRTGCDECRREEAHGACALNMLRLSSIGDEDVAPSLVFEERVIRRLRVQTARESVRYWSPAFFGAAIAGLTVLAALQLVSNRQLVPNVTHPAGEVRLERPQGRLPLIDLDKLDRIR